MKTAGRKNPIHGVRVPHNRAHGAVGHNRSRSIKWAAKQETFQPEEMCFFLTSPFIEQTRRSYQLRLRGARRNYHRIKHVQGPLQLLHLQLSVHSVQMGLVRTESQSPEPSARS